MTSNPRCPDSWDDYLVTCELKKGHKGKHVFTWENPDG